MTEMEEIKTMLVDMNKKLDKVIFQNKIALYTKYGLPFKQEMEESCCKKFREVKHEAVKEFATLVKRECTFTNDHGLDLIRVVDFDVLLENYEVEE